MCVWETERQREAFWDDKLKNTRSHWLRIFFTQVFSIGHKTHFCPNNYIIKIVHRKTNAISMRFFLSWLSIELVQWHHYKGEKMAFKMQSRGEWIIIWRRWWRKMKEKQNKRNGTQTQVVINNSIDPRIKWLNVMKWLQWLHRQAAWKMLVWNEMGARSYTTQLPIWLSLSFSLSLAKK